MIKYLKAATTGIVLASLLAVNVSAQGPYSAQITAALRAFLTTAHTWTGTQTYTNVVINGTCTGAGCSSSSFTAPVTISATALGTTSTDGLIAQNTTAATGGVTVQISPRLRLRGTAWDTAASETIDAFEELLPASAATPTGTIKWGVSINGGAATYPMTLTSAGVLAPLLAMRGVDGSCTAPPYSFASGTNHGMYMAAGTNGPMICAGGIDVALFDAGPDEDFRSDLTLRWSQNSTVSGGTYDTGLKRLSAGILKATNGGAGYGTVDALAYNASGVAGITGTCDTPTFTGGVVTTCNGSGNSADGTYFVTGNFTTANNTNFQAITGLAWTYPATSAVNTPFICSLTYSQATGVVSDSLGIQDVTVAPTNGMVTGLVETAAAVPVYGNLTAFASTTATAVVTFTPGAIGTIYNAYLSGMIEQPSNASTSAFQIQIKTTTGTDAITVYRGSFCKVG